MKPIELRWYQDEAVDSVWHYFAEGGTGNPVVALPTGTGKSVVIGDLVRKILKAYNDQRIIKLTHRKELIQQNFTKLLQLWPLAPAGVYSAGLGRREFTHPVTFAGIASVAKKAELFGRIDLVFIDECHLLGPNESSMYRRFISDLTRVNPYLKVIGFTATPYRLGQGRLTDEGGLFTDVCYDLTTFDAFNRLLAEGYLAPLHAPRPTQFLDVSGVGTSQGDYNQKQLQLAVDKYEVTRSAVEEILHYGQDRKHWLVFASGVEHAQHIADMLNERGIRSVAVYDKMSGRDDAIEKWKAGYYRCAVNNDILTTGIDFPGIDFIPHLQPTKSVVRWIQGLGRGTRPYPGKANCLVLDFAGNTARLGPINDPLVPKAKGKGGGEAPVKICPQCDHYQHASVRHCTVCGHEFVAQVKIKETASTLEVMKSEEAPVETFEVAHVEYSIHQPGRWIGGNTKVDDPRKAPSLKVEYHCKDTPLRFKEYIGLEHPRGFVRHKARDWWRARTGGEPPDTVADASERTAELAEPTHIQVWLKSDYPEIMAHCFDGSGFASE